MSQPIRPGRRPRGSSGSRRRPWLVPALLAVACVALVVGAYSVGRLLSAADRPATVGAGDPGAEAGAESPAGRESRDPGSGDPRATGDPGYDGPVEPLPISAGTATCEAASSVDAAGNPVDYAPRLAFDGDRTTAWRCPGDGAGESITLTVSRGSRIAQVGLVPGYAKTDPRTGADRYAENNRITRVRWTLDGGVSVVQRLDASPDRRAMQTMRIPVTVSRTVVLEVLASRGGRRNTVAVSEVRLGEAAQ